MLEALKYLRPNNGYIKDFSNLMGIFSDNTLLSEDYITQVIKIEGLDDICLSEQERNSIFYAKSNVFKKLDLNFTYSIFTAKNYSKLRNLSTKNRLIGKINDLRKIDLEKTYNSTFFLCVSSKLKYADNGKIIFNDKKLISYFKDKYEELNEYSSNLAMSLSKLGTYKLGKVGLQEFCEDVLNCYVNDLNAKPFVSYQMKEGDNCIEKTDHRDNSKIFVSYLSIFGIGDFVSNKSINRLNSLDVIVNIQQSFRNIESKTSIRIGTIAKMINSLGKHREKSDAEIIDTLQDVSNGDLGLLEVATSFELISNDKEKLKTAVMKLKANLENADFKVIIESFDQDFHFLKKYPSYHDSHIDLRGLHISNDVMSALVNISKPETGLNKCSFGDEPVAFFKTSNNTAFGFTFHGTQEKYAPGHTMVFAPTGSGKTTLLSYLIANCLKYDDMKILAFDSKRGMKISTQAMGGNYLDYYKDTPELNPLDVEGTHQERAFLCSLLKNISGVKEEDSRSIGLIENAINTVLMIDREYRGFVDLKINLGDLDPNYLRKVERWFKQKEMGSFRKYGNIFNGSKDHLNFENPLTVFDMSDLMLDQELFGVLSEYTLFKFEELVTRKGKPHICLVDEIHKYIKYPLFSNSFDVRAKESRKTDGVFIGITQNVKEFVEDPVGEKIVGNLATMLIYPNSSATPDIYMEKLNLNETEFNFIRNTKEPHKLLLKRMLNQESIILDVSLGSIGKYLDIFNSSSRNVDIWEKSFESSKENAVENYFEELTKKRR